VKQQLAAIRQMFDYLVTGGILAVNPAASVRGPKYVVRRGKTPVLSAEQARQLLDCIDPGKLSGLRDRALIRLMLFSFARVGAANTLRVGDYFENEKRQWLRLHEKGGKRHEVPCHHSLVQYLEDWITAASIGHDKKGWLFSSIRKGDKLTNHRMDTNDVLRMIKQRANRPACPIPPAATRFGRPVSPPTSRAAARWNMPNRSRRTNRRGLPSCKIGRATRSRSRKLSASKSEVLHYIRPVLPESKNDI
jgi:integrase